MPGAQDLRPEANLHLIESQVFQGQRVRAFNNTVYFRPIDETFHEFLVFMVAWTFGVGWWRRECGMPQGQRHVVIDWRHAFSAMTKRPAEARVETEHGVRFESTPSGPARALALLGYDLWCAQARKRLPESTVERLKRHRSFQSARYEIAAAAIMARAGFDLKFLDDPEATTKHCEFIATHRESGLQVAVEAKSRVRPGAMNERGEFAYAGDDSRALVRLVRDACKQGVPGMPLIVFLDLNLPPAQWQWLADVNTAAKDLERAARQRGEAGEPYAALIATNFGFHFEPAEGRASPPETVMIIPTAAKKPVPQALLHAIALSCGKYHHIPHEVYACAG